MLFGLAFRNLKQIQECLSLADVVSVKWASNVSAGRGFLEAAYSDATECPGGNEHEVVEEGWRCWTEES